MMQTILITNQPDIARDAQNAGVDRIMVDLEIIGKKERQQNRNTFISSHIREDISVIRQVLDKAQLIVRINPWHAGSESEIEDAIARGADLIMLPMITGPGYLRQCVDSIAGRAQCLPLVETKYSMQHVEEIAAMKEISELYIGLNDLHLELRLEFLFEPLAMGLVDNMAKAIKQHGKTFGFGGIAKIGSGELPAGHILAEHERLGSSRVILSSRFCKDVMIDDAAGRKQRIEDALHAMHEEYARFAQRSKQEKEIDSKKTFAIIQNIAAELKEKRQAQ